MHDELHVTSIFVTHDQEEALEVADRVVLMNSGKIEQVGTPQQVWDNPASPFVYGFLGDVNLFHGRTHGGQVQIGPIARLELLRTETTGNVVADLVEAQMTAEEYKSLGIAEGDKLVLTPRRARVWLTAP